MDPFMLGVLVFFLIFGLGSWFLYSTSSAVVSARSALGIASVGGVLGTVTTVFSDTWKFIVASMYGHLGLYGWIFIIGLVACLLVWFWNGLQDLSKNRPISFVE